MLFEVRTEGQAYKDRRCVDHRLGGKPLLGFLLVSPGVFPHEETIISHIRGTRKGFRGHPWRCGS